EYYKLYEKRQAELERRKYDGIGWYPIANGELGPQTSAPAGIEYPPLKDALTVPAEDERWRVTAGQVELRSDGEALYRVTQGKLAKVRDGKYLSLAISADGKWALASRYTEEYDIVPVRINLATGREFPVALQEMTTPYIVSFMPSVGQFLMSSYLGGYASEDDYHGEDEGWDGTNRSVRSDLGNMSFGLLNPATGAVQKAPGEARPIAHETFRRLQPAGKPNEFWAAMPDNGKDQTVVGIYDARFFNFKPVVVVPKMNFNSMDMWVDQPGGKVYFVYKGHVLAVPLAAPPVAAPKS
ncbi:MAG: hypothetical protein QUS14_07055, partial [Pyrinomonadaceae bacterium]|nr:hypothetical protein [Pyrinomonadaceae bacterium]